MMSTTKRVAAFGLASSAFALALVVLSFLTEWCPSAPAPDGSLEKRRMADYLLWTNTSSACHAARTFVQTVQHQRYILRGRTAALCLDTGVAPRGEPSGCVVHSMETGPLEEAMDRQYGCRVLKTTFPDGGIVDYLKVDAGDLDEWIRSGALSHVRQLGVQVEWPDDATLQQLRGTIALIRMVDAKMVRFHSHYNGLHDVRAYDLAWYNPTRR